MPSPEYHGLSAETLDPSELKPPGGAGEERGAHHVSHVGLELKLHRRTEDVVVHLHEALLVTGGVQVFYSVLDGVQTLVLRLFQVQLGREEGAQRAVQAGVVS